MNFNDMRTIQKAAIVGGASAEAEVTRAVSALQKKISPFILSLDLDISNRTLLMVLLEEELKYIQELETQYIEQLTKVAYNYSLQQTLAAYTGQYIVNTSLAIGYSGNWVGDGKTASMRVASNITAIINELNGLIIGYQGDDYVVLRGLVFTILQKVISEFKRLIRTELQAAWSQGARDAYLEMGCYYAVIENNDPCDRICAGMVGEHQVNLHGRLGIDLPPYHPNCQCIFLGIFRK